MWCKEVTKNCHPVSQLYKYLAGFVQDCEQLFQLMICKILLTFDFLLIDLLTYNTKWSLNLWILLGHSWTTRG